MTADDKLSKSVNTRLTAIHLSCTNLNNWQNLK